MLRWNESTQSVSIYFLIFHQYGWNWKTEKKNPAFYNLKEPPEKPRGHQIWSVEREQGAMCERSEEAEAADWERV